MRKVLDIYLCLKFVFVCGFASDVLVVERHGNEIPKYTKHLNGISGCNIISLICFS